MVHIHFQGHRSKVKSGSDVLKILWTRWIRNRWRDFNQNLHKYFIQSGDELITSFTRSWIQRSRSQTTFFRTFPANASVLRIATKKCKFVKASASGWLCPHPSTRGMCPCTPLEESQITSQDLVGSTNFITLPAPLFIEVSNKLNALRAVYVVSLIFTQSTPQIHILGLAYPFLWQFFDLPM